MDVEGRQPGVDLTQAYDYNLAVAMRRDSLIRPTIVRLVFALTVAALAVPIAPRANTGSRIEIHYAPRENLETVDVAQIGRAKLSIDMAAYVLSDRPVIEALTEAAEHDVVIRLYLDKSQFAEHEPAPGSAVEALLAQPNVSARVKPSGILMHLKAYAVDGALLRTGSSNFSRSGLAAQDNDLILISDQGIVDAFEINFDRIWSQAEHAAPPLSAVPTTSSR